MEKSNLSPEKSPDKTPQQAPERREDRREFRSKPEAPKYPLYRVQAGDSLSAIAKKFYDDAGLYMKIYEANKELIGDDPNLIKVDMELKVPNLDE